MSTQLPIRLIRPAQPLDIGAVASLPTLGAACAKCAEWGGLQDKTVCIETGIDAASWSRIKQGQTNPAGDFLEALMDAAGNEAPLLWLLWRRGYDPASLHKRESELERQLREAREQNDQLKDKLETITEFVRGTVKAP